MELIAPWRSIWDSSIQPSNTILTLWIRGRWRWRRRIKVKKVSSSNFNHKLSKGCDIFYELCDKFCKGSFLFLLSFLFLFLFFLFLALLQQFFEIVHHFLIRQYSELDQQLRIAFFHQCDKLHRWGVIQSISIHVEIDQGWVFPQNFLNLFYNRNLLGFSELIIPNVKLAECLIGFESSKQLIHSLIFELIANQR